jgi:homoserine dehydrogenase
MKNQSLSRDAKYAQKKILMKTFEHIYKLMYICGILNGGWGWLFTEMHNYILYLFTAVAAGQL